MMFANLIQQTKKIIQEKYLKHDNDNTMVTDETNSTDEQFDERALEMKDQIFGQYSSNLILFHYFVYF